MCAFWPAWRSFLFDLLLKKILVSIWGCPHTLIAFTRSPTHATAVTASNNAATHLRTGLLCYFHSTLSLNLDLSSQLFFLCSFFFVVLSSSSFCIDRSPCKFAQALDQLVRLSLRRLLSPLRGQRMGALERRDGGADAGTRGMPGDAACDFALVNDWNEHCCCLLKLYRCRKYRSFCYMNTSFRLCVCV